MTASELLVFARCAGFIFRAPGLSHPSVPHAVRAAMALLLACAIGPRQSVVARDGIVLIALLVMEFVLGSLMGLAASLLYDGAYAAGRMLDDYVGVKAIAPNLAIVAPSGFGRVWSIAFTGGYFLFGAYRLTLYGLAQSFERIPLGVPVAARAWTTFAFSYASTIVQVALEVAAPAIALAFVTQVTLAALARTIPRFASFTLSFPLVFGVVLIATAISIPLASARAIHPLMLFPGDAR
jgi:flagellar biosynthetic protein FliR